MSRTTTRPDPPSAFTRGLLLVLAPLAAAFAPLLFHRSPQPSVLGYSAPHAVLLSACALLAGLVATVVGLRCRARGSLKPAARALFFLFVLGASLTGVEIFLRVRYGDAFATYRKWGQRRSTIFTFEAEPDHSWSAFGGDYSTDHFGFRTHMRRPDWHAHWKRAERDGRTGNLVMVIGGSSAFGYGLHDDATWPHLLDRKLALSSPGTAVVNAANNGHGSLQVLLRLYLKVLPQKPSHVLFYGAINDVHLTRDQLGKMREHEEIVLAPSQVAYLAQKYPGRNPYARTMLAYLAEQRLPDLLRRLAGRGRERIVDRRPLDELQRARIRQNAASFARNLRTMADMCRRSDARLILTTFLFDESCLPRYYSEALRVHNDALREVARGENVPLIDLAAAFAASDAMEEMFFPDCYHPAWQGARFIAGQLARALGPMLANR